MRDVVITGTGDCTETYPKVINSLSCDKTCPPGTYLEIIDSTLDCNLCPLGTYSVGGGFNYGREGLDWSLALKSVINDCWFRVNSTDYHNYNCTPWNIESGVLVSSEINEANLLTSSLTFSLKIVKLGKFSIKYRKDTYRLNGHKVGYLSISVNNENVLIDNEIDQSNWKSFDFELQIGLNEIVVDYITKKVDGVSYPKAYIATVEVVGTKFADTECYMCLVGGNSMGASSCETCDFNEYWNNGVCEDCPSGTYSFKGSVSVDSCLARAPCVESDFKPVYTECVNGQRNLYYAWREPVFCDINNYKLPENLTGLACEPCQLGYFNQTQSLGNSKCVPCQAGTYFNSNSSSCDACAAGKYARRQLNITNWTDIPSNFSTFCITYNGSPCPHSLGWIPSTNFITTGLAVHNDSELFLNRFINIESNFGFVKVNYEFSTKGSGSIDVYVDGTFIETWTGHQKNEAFVNLNQGQHYVQWVYWAAEGIEEEVKIYSMKIFGSDEGSAQRCLSCIEGYISNSSQSFCTACPEGTSSNIDNTKCVKCPENTYSNSAIGKCIKCPTGAVPNADQTNCIGTDYAYFNLSSYYLRNISGYGTVENDGVCDMPTAQLYCHQTFYGPLPDNNVDFYISILNPSILELPNADYYYSKSPAFAFAVFDKKHFTGYSSNQDSCIQEKLIINLGTIISKMSPLQNGYKITYSHGDTCISDPYYYNSTISIICDKKTGTGWPVFESESMCTFNFRWLTKFGCRECLTHELKTVSSECVNGIRTYKKIENEDCITSYFEQTEWTESCSEVDEIIDSWPMIVGLSLLACFILVSLISLVVYCKYKRRYDRLNESTRNI